jgi:hypothetical protein
MIIVIALYATNAAGARTHHRASKNTALPVATKPVANIPQEKNRDPADVALDHKIKGICNGC